MSTNEIIDSSPTTPQAGIEVWRVQLLTGELRAMTLDALDDAFQSGLITENTPVLPPGATAWTKLGDAAGLGDESPSHDMVPSVAPLAVSIPSAGSTGDATRYAAHAPLTDEALMQLAVDDEAAFKPKRGRMFAVIGIAVVLVGGLGFGASRLSAGINASATSSLSAQAGESKAAATPPPAAVDLNAAAPAKQLTDAQKAKLAEADKAREAAAAAREEKRRLNRPPPPLRRSGTRDKSAPFVNGGSRSDPLNGSL